MSTSSSSCPGRTVGLLGLAAVAGSAAYLLFLHFGRRPGTIPAAVEEAVPSAEAWSPAAEDTEDASIAAAVASESAHNRRRGDAVDLDAEVDEALGALPR